MAERTQIGELDLLAYADGLLDDDPMRKARVEERLSEPVPERLHATLDRKPRSGVQVALRAAAVLAFAVGTGVGGWLIGQWGDEAPWSAGELVQQSYAHFMATDAGRLLGPRMNGSASEVRPLAWLADEVSLTLKAPDLSGHGFSLVDKTAVTVVDMQMVRLDYAAGDGRTFSLFIAPRWDTDPVEITPAERDGASLAYWLDGPLASAVVARMPTDETTAIAEAVHEALQSAGNPPAVLDPTPSGPHKPGDGMMADSLADPAVETHPQPLSVPGNGQTKKK